MSLQDLKLPLWITIVIVATAYTNTVSAVVKFHHKYSVRFNGNFVGTLTREVLENGDIKLSLSFNVQKEKCRPIQTVKKKITDLLHSGASPKAPDYLEYIGSYYVHNWRNLENQPDTILITYTISSNASSEATDSDKSSEAHGVPQPNTPEPLWLPDLPSFPQHSIILEHAYTDGVSVADNCYWKTGICSDHDMIAISYSGGKKMLYNQKKTRVKSPAELGEEFNPDVPDVPDEGTDERPQYLQMLDVSSTHKAAAELAMHEEIEPAQGSTVLFSTHHESLLAAAWTQDLNLNAQPFIAFQNPMEILPAQYLLDTFDCLFTRSEQTLVPDRKNSMIIQKDPDRDTLPSGRQVLFFLDEHDVIRKISFTSDSEVTTLDFISIDDK